MEKFREDVSQFAHEQLELEKNEFELEKSKLEIGSYDDDTISDINAAIEGQKSTIERKEKKRKQH